MPRITKPLGQRRQEIIETARRLFFENGFDKTQISDISKGMNVAQGLVYHYFKSKTEILYAVIDELSGEHAAATGKALSDFEGSALSCLRMLFESGQNSQSYGSLFGNTMNDQGIKAYCGMKMTLSMMPLLLMLIRRGNADGSWLCEYPAETAAFILHGINGVFDPEHIEQDDENRREAFSNILFRLLGKRPQSDTDPGSDPAPETLPRRMLETHDNRPYNKISNPQGEELPECLL